MQPHWTEEMHIHIDERKVPGWCTSNKECFYHVKQPIAGYSVLKGD